jgi:hypothetical protein
MRRSAQRFSFLLKLPAALMLIAAADWLFDDFRIGSWFGGLALLWVAVLAVTRPALRRGLPRAALGVAALFAVALVRQPSFLAWMLFWAALSTAALLPRTAGFDNAFRWALRLAAHALSGPFTPLLDFFRLARTRNRQGRVGLAHLVAVAALPLAMTALFVLLFAAANPLIDHALTALRFPWPSDLLLWAVVLILVWPSLRPRAWTSRTGTRLPHLQVMLPGAFPTSVLISLALFNLIFAIQNGLDLAFLWSGAPLPNGMTLAEYAHRGAYPLIVTALLAGLFVLTTLQPGAWSCSGSRRTCCSSPPAFFGPAITSRSICSPPCASPPWCGWCWWRSAWC